MTKDLRECLNEHAPRYYEGKRTGDEDLVEDAVRSIGLDTMGFDCIGNGSGRNVFDMSVLGYPDKCLKLAIPHPQYDGVGQNEREVELWNSLGASQKEYLAPVLDFGPEYYWLVMPQGERVSRLPYHWKQDVEFYLDEDIWSKDMGTDNIVRIEGELKLCDYGTPPQ